MAGNRFVLIFMFLALAFGVAARAAESGPSDNSPDGGKAPTFYKDILPLAQAHCQTCHRPGQIGPFSLLDYQSARPWAKAIKNAVSARRMPPWLANPEYGHFNN